MLSRILSSTVVEEKDGEGRGVEYEPKGRVACGGGKKRGRRQMQRGNGERTAKEGRGGVAGAPRLPPGGLRFGGGRDRRTQAESEFQLSFRVGNPG